MSVSYSLKAIDAVVRYILRAKAGDSHAASICVQMLDNDSVAALESACRKKNLYGKVGWSIYHDVGALSKRFFSADQLANSLKIIARDFDTHISLSCVANLEPYASAQDALKEAEESPALKEAESRAIAKFVEENHLIPSGESERIVFRDEETLNEFMEHKREQERFQHQWREDFSDAICDEFSKLRTGVTGESAVVFATPKGYKNHVRVSVQNDGKIIAWVSQTFRCQSGLPRHGTITLTSMCSSDGIVLSNEEMQPSESWFEGASSSSAKKYIVGGGKFGKYIPTDVNPLKMH